MSPTPIHFFYALFATLFIMSINSFLLVEISAVTDRVAVADM